MISSLADSGVEFLDLTQAYSGVREALYVDDCCHVSPRGYEMLVPSIAAAVERQRRRLDGN